MIKSWPLAVGLGIAFWILIFVIISALIIIPLPAIVLSILGTLVGPAVALGLAIVYFKRNPGDIKEGIVLAVFWLIVGTILDLAVTMQYIKANIGGTFVEALKAFYGDWTLWVSFILTVIVVALVAKFLRGGAIMKPPVQQPQAPPVQTPPRV